MATLAEIMAKKQAAASTASAPVIRQADEKVALAATIKATLDGTAPKIQPLASQPRELGATERGERIPMDYPPQDAPEEATKWFRSLHSFATDLCVVIDPEAPRAWIAVAPQGMQHAPLLLYPLPLHNRSLNGQPF